MDDSVPDLRPSLRTNIKDLILVIGALVGAGTWAYSHIRSFVDVSDFERYKTAQELRDRVTEDRARAIESNVNELRVRSGEHTVQLNNLQNTSDHIERILEHRR